jgi:hypothetical protein
MLEGLTLSGSRKALNMLGAPVENHVGNGVRDYLAGAVNKSAKKASPNVLASQTAQL